MKSDFNTAKNDRYLFCFRNLQIIRMIIQMKNKIVIAEISGSLYILKKGLKIGLKIGLKNSD